MTRPLAAEIDPTKAFVVELVEEIREVAYKQDWSGSALDTVVGIVRKVALHHKRRRISRRRGRGNAKPPKRGRAAK
jgi:hypothetical protein